MILAKANRALIGELARLNLNYSHSTNRDYTILVVSSDQPAHSISNSIIFYLHQFLLSDSSLKLLHDAFERCITPEFLISQEANLIQIYIGSRTLIYLNMS
jgi:hypothetical protein